MSYTLTRGLRNLALPRLPGSSTNHNVWCLVGNNRYASTTSANTTIATSGIAPLTNRTLLRISGRDAPKFLQGLTTNNVDPGRTDGWYTAFLNATGRVFTDAFLWPLKADAKGNWACLLDVDSSVADRLRLYMKKHKLRSKVDISQAEGAQVWSAWGQDTAHEFVEYKAPDLEGDHVQAVGQLSDPRVPGFSTRLITTENTSVPRDALAGLFSSLPSADLDQYNLHRYLNGIPEGPHEMYSEHYQAHPSNLDHLNAVDFRKGCYVGQELTIRTEHTGVVRKRILPVQIYKADTPLPTSLEYSPKGINSASIPFETKITATGAKRETGKWLVGTGNVGLAICRLENMTDVKVSAEGGTYTEQSEFSLQAEGVENFRVKAFVPDWLRDRLSKSRKPRT